VEEETNSNSDDDTKDDVVTFQNWKSSKINKKAKKSTSRPSYSSGYRARTRAVAIPIVMENIAFTAKSRSTLKKNVGKESETINCAKTNKDRPTGQKCT